MKYLHMLQPPQGNPGVIGLDSGMSQQRDSRGYIHYWVPAVPFHGTVRFKHFHRMSSTHRVAVVIEIHPVHEMRGVECTMGLATFEEFLKTQGIGTDGLITADFEWKNSGGVVALTKR